MWNTLVRLMVLGPLCVCVTMLSAVAAGEGGDLSGAVLSVAPSDHGVCAVVGCADGDLPMAIVRNSELFVHVVEMDGQNVGTLREKAAGQGVGIERLLVEGLVTAGLPYADNLIDLLVIPDARQEVLKRVTRAEVVRVLRPGGRGVVIALGENADDSGLKEWLGPGGRTEKFASGRWGFVEKAVPAGIDQWTHWEHGPDNNPVSIDAVIRAPYRTQWMASPYYIAMPAITTAAGGRTFTAMGHIAHHDREEPWLNTVVARNGYNGAELWRKRVPDGYLVHRSAFVAAEDRFYMIEPEGAGCLILEAETGAELERIRFSDAPGDWKWMAIDDGVLYALVGGAPDPTETTIVRSQFAAWSWGELSKGYYEEPRIPWGFGETVVAYSLKERKVLWKHKEDVSVDSRAMALGGGRVFFYAPDRYLGCLNATNGEVVWTNEDKQTRDLIEEAGRGLESTPGFRTACICVYTPKALYYQGQTKMNLVAVSLDDGHLLWHREKTTNNPNVIYLDDKILVGIGPGGNTLVLDPATGETIEDLGFRKRSCARLTATADSVFCRGMPDGLTRYDRVLRKVFFDAAFRPACNDGAIGANGLLYITPWLCDCNLSLMGAVALASAAAETPAAESAVRLDERLFPGGDGVVTASTSSDLDWPAYRGGSAHSAGSKVSVGTPLQVLWKWSPEKAYTPSAPTAAGGLIFIAGDDGLVRAFEGSTGSVRWVFRTGGPVLDSPTVWEGRVFVGSGDGFLYALDAATGGLLWRFHVAPVERKIMRYGRLCSVWPVDGGPVVEDGIVYVAAGIIDFDGTYVCALDARTGAVKWENDSSGYLNPTLRKGVSALGNLTVTKDSVWMAGGNLISPARYDRATGNYSGREIVNPEARSNRGEEVGVLGGDVILCGGRPRFSALENIVNQEWFEAGANDRARIRLCGGIITPAWDESLFVSVPAREGVPRAFECKGVCEAARGAKGGELRMKPLWSAQRLERARTEALAVAGDSVVAVCGIPLQRDYRWRWFATLLDRENGTPLGECGLPGAPRINGAAIDRDGRVIVAMADGGLCCLGGRQAFTAYVGGLVAAAAEGKQRDEAVANVKRALESVHDKDSRGFLIGSLEKIGIDVRAAEKQRGAILSWRLLGLVPWDADHAADKLFFDAGRVKVDRECKVGGERLAWMPYTTIDDNGMVDLAGVFGDKEAVAAFAYAEIELTEAQDLRLNIGSNDGFVCWFNGKEAGRFEGGRIYVPDQNVLVVSGKKGVNAVLLKVLQQGGKWAFGVRVTDGQDKPVRFVCRGL